MTALSVWRVELLRVIRTRRLLALAILHLFLGATAPLLARFAGQIVSGIADGTAMTVTFADPRPADGILEYNKSALQIGLVADVALAALALTLDARPALSAYYRTRASIPRLLLPRLAVTAASVVACSSLGFAFAWYETAVLIGAPDTDTTVATWALGTAYVVFAVAITFLISTVLSGTLAAAGTTIGVLLLMPVLGGIRAISDYVPSRLTTLPADLYAGSEAGAAAAALIVATVLGLGGSLVGLRRLRVRGSVR